MATRNLGIAAGGVSFALFAILQLFDTQNWTMPDSLGVVFTIGLSSFGLVAAAVALNEIRKGLFWLLGQFEWHRPIVRKGLPDPKQWLLDIAKEDAENPARFLLITDTMITKLDFSPDIEMPWIELGVELLNCNVHAVTVGGVSGRARFHGNELREAVIEVAGKSHKPRGHRHVYRMKQYLSPDQAVQIHAERLEETKAAGSQRRKELRSLDLSGVAIEVECEGNVTSLGLVGADRFRYT